MPDLSTMVCLSYLVILFGKLLSSRQERLHWRHPRVRTQQCVPSATKPQQAFNTKNSHRANNRRFPRVIFLFLIARYSLDHGYSAVTLQAGNGLVGHGVRYATTSASVTVTIT
jgi:hypothetical protein